MLGSVATLAVSTCTYEMGKIPDGSNRPSAHYAVGSPGGRDEQGMNMNTTHILKRGIVGLIATVLVSGGLGLAGLGLAGTAQARPTWCPGENKPAEPPWPDFQWNSCYEYSGAGGNYGWIDLGTGIFHPMPLDIPAAPPPPNPPECVGFFPLPGVDPSHCVI